MPDNNNNMPNGLSASSIIQTLDLKSLSSEATLKAIYVQLNDITTNGIRLSQATLQDMAASEESVQKNSEERLRRNQGKSATGRTFTPDFSDVDFTNEGTKKSRRKGLKGQLDDLEEQFSREFKKALFGSASPFADMLKQSLSGLADQLGVSLDKVGTEVGKRLGTSAGNWAANLKFRKNGRTVGENISRMRGRAQSAMNRAAYNFGQDLGGARSEASSEDIQNSSGTSGSDSGPNIVNAAKRANRTAKDIQKAKDFIEGQFREVGTNASKVANAGTQSAEAANAVASQATQATATAVEQSASVMAEAGAEIGTELVPAAGQAAAGLADAAAGAGAAGSAGAGAAASLTEAGAEIGTELVPAAGQAAAGLADAAAGAGAAAGAAIPVIGLVILVLELLADAMGPAIEGFKQWTKAAKKAINRNQEQAKINMEAAQRRLKADVEGMTRASFDVIMDAAKKVEQAWDSTLRTITGAQGYTKESMQDLWSEFADRLRIEGLASVVSSADLMGNLESVLKQGLSGKVAEEFAYQATLLNAAIPTQDFFQFASTYASIAANAAKSGASEVRAIEIANEELNSFANNLLYASRQIAGGFTTSLTNASSLFEDATKIAQASRTGSVSTISGVLASVSAIVGATAPDLANTLVSAVVDAATGGNSSELTALRSLAGTGASNTAFLQALATDPQKVFTALFRNLSQMQNMSSANYMEVAEALSSVFGLSRDAFARVDFGYVADAISSMNLNSNALAENVGLLKDGQTTSNADQLRMQKINEYMIEEGLAYVLDNEVGRAIQEHMWDEQIAREIEGNTFAIEFTGATMALIQGIWESVDKILSILNPVKWLEKAANLLLTIDETAAQKKDIENVLKAGVVGSGRSIDLFDLTNNNTDLNLTKSYIELLGGTSAMNSTLHSVLDWSNSFWNFAGTVDKANARKREKALAQSGVSDASGSAASSGSSNFLSNIWGSVKNAVVNSPVGKTIGAIGEAFSNTALGQWIGEGIDKLKDSAKSAFDSMVNKAIHHNSVYTTQLISKSNADAMASTIWHSMSNGAAQSAVAAVTQSVTQASADALAQTLQSSMTAYAAETAALNDPTANRGFGTWLSEFEKTNRSALQAQYGLNYSMDQILTDYGSSMEALESAFLSTQVAQSNVALAQRDKHEEQFWTDMQNFATQQFPDYVNMWSTYYVTREAYSTAAREAYNEAIELRDKQKAQTGDAITALADALVQSADAQNIDALKDPALQTNVLLSKLLLVAEAMLQISNTPGAAVPTSLSGMGTGGRRA